MSDYHRDRRNRGSDDKSGIPWPLIIIVFCIFWPIGIPAGVLVGIGLLLLKLSQDSKFQKHKEDWVNSMNNQGTPFAQQQEAAAQRQAERQAARRARYGHAHEWAQAQSVPNTDTQPKSAPTAEEKIRKQAEQQAQRRAERQTRKEPRYNRRSPSKLKKGTALSVIGGIIAVFHGMFTCHTLVEWITYDTWYAIQQSIVPFFLTSIGCGLFAWGRFKHRQSKRLRRMLTMIGKQTVIDIRQLADAMGSSYAKTCDDIQELIDGGYLGENAYINMATGQLFLDTDGFQSVEKKKPSQEEATDQDAKLLAEIRQLDDDIDDEEMSRKIRRIEECTEHILEYQKKHPDKASELHTFLDYYLPTTMKLLHAYAELEDQGVAGDNISTTKARIESTMDSVVQGFEAQLDKLFEGSMLDISADISVMEKMLSRDGLAGGMKMPKAPTELETPAQSVPYTPTLTLDPNGDSAAAVQTMPEEEGQG